MIVVEDVTGDVFVYVRQVWIDRIVARIARFGAGPAVLVTVPARDVVVPGPLLFAEFGRFSGIEEAMRALHDRGLLDSVTP